MDTQGDLLGALVKAANSKDWLSLLKLIQKKAPVSALKLIYGDSAYRAKEARCFLEDNGLPLKIVSGPRSRRWVHKDHIA